MARFVERYMTFTVLISSVDEKLPNTRDMLEDFIALMKAHQLSDIGEVSYIFGPCSLECKRVEK